MEDVKTNTAYENNLHITFLIPLGINDFVFNRSLKLITSQANSNKCIISTCEYTIFMELMIDIEYSTCLEIGNQNNVNWRTIEMTE